MENEDLIFLIKKRKDQKRKDWFFSVKKRKDWFLAIK